MPSSSDSIVHQKTLDPILTFNVNITSSDRRNPENEFLSQESSSDDDSDDPCLLPSQHLSTITSLCFLQSQRSTVLSVPPFDDSEVVENDMKTLADLENSHDDDDDKDDPIRLRCHDLVRHEKAYDDDVTAPAREISAALSLSGRVLATCHSHGECHLWDLGRRCILGEIASAATSKGPGMLIRRIQNDNESINAKIIYQTRDEQGTVSLYDCNTLGAVNSSVRTTPKVIAAVQTQSQTFCTAAPCYGNPNLIVTPWSESSFAAVRDWRVNPAHSPVALFHGVEGIGDSEQSLSMDRVRRHGMLMSLTMTDSASHGKTLVACGMESGTVAFHDLAMLRKKHFPESVGTADEGVASSTISLCKDAVLSLDVSPSRYNSEKGLSLISSSCSPSTCTTKESIVVVAGLAGNVDDMLELPESERGRVTILKVTTQSKGLLDARIRARLSSTSTCVNVALAKPGAALCRFRPGNGRIFAVGGWDQRVRIYDRVTSHPLAILRGHTKSVQTIDWASDASESGLLASGSSDGIVHIWRCFPTS